MKQKKPEMILKSIRLKWEITLNLELMLTSNFFYYNFVISGPTTKGARKKKLAFVADASDKSLTLPFPSCQRTLKQMQVFLHLYNYMFLKQEKPEMDDFLEIKTLVLKEK